MTELTNYGRTDFNNLPNSIWKFVQLNFRKILTLSEDCLTQNLGHLPVCICRKNAQARTLPEPQRMVENGQFWVVQGTFSRGDHSMSLFLRVSPMIVFSRINDFGLVPVNLKQWFCSSFIPKLGLFKLWISTWKSHRIKKIMPLLF